MPDLSHGHTSPSGAGAAASSVPPSTGRAAVSEPVVVRQAVSAVVLVRDGAARLARCLDALAAQTVLPSRLLIVDVASSDTSMAIAQAHSRVRHAIRDVQIHRIDQPVPDGVAINLAAAELAPLEQPDDAPAATSEWLWVVPDRAVPLSTALERLLDAAGRSPSVGVAGPKVVDAADPRRLVSLGLQVTRTGRLMASPKPGEADQGQHDQREDVLAVTLSGMIIRRDVLADLGGFDPAFDGVGADLDLGWRAHLAGHRVIVVPGATVLRVGQTEVRDRAADQVASPDGRRSRRAARRVALARCSLAAMPFMATWIALSSLTAALVLLLAKRPRAAWRELGDLGALLRPAAVLGARWRGRRTRRLRGSDLRTLFVSPVAAARSTLDHIQDSITPERARPRREAAPTTETGPTSDESEAFGVLPPALGQRIATHPGVVAVTTTLLVSVIAWRDGLRAGALSPTGTGLAGGELRPVASDSSGLWHAFWDAWHGSGLGSGGESGPHLAVLAAVTWVAELLPGMSESRSTVGVTLAWLLFLAPALSAWSAYLASRVLSVPRSARAVVALAWASSSVLTTAVADGRLTAALGHVLVPFVLAGFALAARRHGSYTATFATALAVALLAAVEPPYLALTSAAALGLLVFGPGTRRLRALVLLLAPLAVLATWTGSVIADWRLLLSGPGLLSTVTTTPPWQMVLGHPGHPGQPAGQESATSSTLLDAAAGVAVWAALPLLAVGVLGYARRAAGRGESVGLAITALAGLTGLSVALGSGRFVLGSAETGVGTSGAAHLWAGAGLQLWVAAVLVGILVASRPAVVAPGARPTASLPGRWLVAGKVGRSAALLVPVLVLLTVWGAAGFSRTLTVDEARLPAVAVEQSKDPLSNRLLLLRPSDEVVDFVLVGREPGHLLRDLDRPASADDRSLVDVTARLVGGRATDVREADELVQWGIGFVQVQAGPDNPLTRRLDATEGLSRLGSSDQGILWRVVPQDTAPGAAPAAAPSRVRVVDADGRHLALVPTRGPHGAVEERVSPGPQGRLLVVAEPLEWARHAVVSVGGEVLQPVSGSALPSYALPPGGGLLRIDLAASQPWLRLGQGLALAFVIFMALPFGNRRSRRSPS